MITYDTTRSFAVACPRAEVWKFFWNVPEVARCLPGCEEVTTLADQRSYAVRVRRRMGPFRTNFELNIDVAESSSPSVIILDVHGVDRVLRSELRQRLSVFVRETSSLSTTDVTIETRVTLEGLLSSLSRALIKMQIDGILDEFMTAAVLALPTVAP